MLRPRSSATTDAAALLLAAPLALAGCKDISSWNSGSGSYQGAVVAANFILAGVAPGTSLCLTLDTAQLEGSPGALSSSDGRFRSAPLRSVPELWQDPLSTLTFGEGRVRNMVYVASPSPGDDGGGEIGDVTVVLSLMQSGAVEARLLRGAPPVAGSDAGSASALGPNLFALFSLSKQSSACSY